jgi:hypothetical protein
MRSTFKFKQKNIRTPRSELNVIKDVFSVSRGWPVWALRLFLQAKYVTLLSSLWHEYARLFEVQEVSLSIMHSTETGPGISAYSCVISIRLWEDRNVSQTDTFAIQNIHLLSWQHCSLQESPQSFLHITPSLLHMVQARLRNEPLHNLVVAM